jgi:hypothetical protein
MELGLAGNGPPEQDKFYTVSTDIGREYFVMVLGELTQKDCYPEGGEMV